MTNILRTTGVAFTDQTYFQTFNWHNFTPGDIVWLDDYEGQDCRDNLAAIFIKETGGDVFIRVLTNISARTKGFDDCVNISELQGPYWKTFLDASI